MKEDKNRIPFDVSEYVMRRALRDVSRVAEEMTRGTMTGESVDRKTVDAWAMRLCEIISRGLDTPLRNCDVGTAEEQMQRKMEFCYKQGGCSNCSFNKSATLTQCALAWAQMPYEEPDTNK